MNTYDANLGAKTTAASTTVVFTASDVPAGAHQYSFYMTGAGNTLTNTTRLRAKANGQSLWDISPAQLRAFLARMTQGYQVLAAAATRWTLPFDFPDVRDGSAVMSAFPDGITPTFEIVLNGSAGAGSAFAAWGVTPMPANARPTLKHKYLGQVLNIAASQTNARYPITVDGALRGFAIPTTGLNRVKVVLNGVQIINVDGTQILEIQAQEGDQAQALTDPIFIRFDEAVPIAPGNSYIEVDTSGSWAGVSNEVALYTIHPINA